MKTAKSALAIAIVATGAALFAIAFREALRFVYGRFGRHDVLELFESLPIGLRIALPAAGGLAAGLIVITKTGNVMEAPRRLSMRTALRKALGSWIAIATGGSVGREGPLIQFGGSLGNAMARLTKLDARMLVSAGTAAGFAAAYNTPFAAVLFVFEVTNDGQGAAPSVAVLLATAISTLIVRSVSGGGPIYGERAFASTSPFELLAFAALAVISAFAAQAFMRALSFGEHAFAKLPLPWRAAAGGLLVGGLAAALPAVTGNGYEPLNRILDGRYTVAFVLVVAGAKVLSTTFSVSSGSPGGVFTPSLLLGGGLGFAWGNVVHASAGGGYALVGMAAVIAATTHAPLMASVFVFEVSGDYALVLPLTVATSLASALSRRLSPDSIYATEAKRA